MARIVGKVDEPRHGAKAALLLGLSDLATLDLPPSSLSTADLERAATAAVDAWGFCGVGLRWNHSWAGAILITTDAGVPRTHPVLGSDPHAAAMIVHLSNPSLSSFVVGRRLIPTLSSHLHQRVLGIEAHSSSGTILAPSPAWLTRMGFRRLRYPIGRYRLDFTALAIKLLTRLQGVGRGSVLLAPQGATREA